MKKLALLLGIAASAHAQRIMDAPLYTLGQGSVFDTSKGVLQLPNNYTQLFTLPTPCKPGQVQATATGVYYCGPSQAWVQLAFLDQTGVIASGSLPNIGTLPGQLVQGQIPVQITTNIVGNSSTATAFAATPTLCEAPSYARGVAPNGNAACSQVQFSELSGVPSFVLQSSLGVTVATLDTNQQLTASQIPGIPWSKLTGIPLANVAFTGHYGDLSGAPAIPTDDAQLSNGAGYITASSAPVKSVNGQTGEVQLTIPSSDSQLTNDADYITLQQAIAAAPVKSVNGLTGAVSLSIPTDDAQLSNGAGYLMQAYTMVEGAGTSSAQRSKLNFAGPFSVVDNSANGSTDVGLSVAIPTDDSQLSNGAGYVTASEVGANAPVKSVNGQTGVVVLAIPTDDSQLTNNAGYLTQAPVTSVNGMTGTVVVPLPTKLSQLQNDPGYITAAQAPVQSVNSQTGAVVLAIPTDDAQLANGAGYLTSANMAAAAPVKSVNGLTGAVVLTIPTDDQQLANGAAYITGAGAYSQIQQAGANVPKRSTLNVLAPLQAVDNNTNSSTDLSLSVPIPTDDAQLANGAGYVTVATAPVLSVNTQTGNVVLPIPTKTSQLINDSGFLTAFTSAVTSVNGLTGAVTLSIPTDDTQLTNNAQYVNAAGAAAAAPVQSVNGLKGAVAITIPTDDAQLGNSAGYITAATAAPTVENSGTPVIKRGTINFVGPLQAIDNPGNSSTDISLSTPIPTDDAQIGNSAGYVNADAAADAAPVQSVNGLTGNVTLNIPTDDSQIANGAGYITSGQAVTIIKSSGSTIAQSNAFDFIAPLQAVYNTATGEDDISLTQIIPTRTSQLINDSGFLTSSTNAVTSVNGLTGAVTLSIPTDDAQIGNGAGYISASQAPVQSVNGKTGTVVLTIPTDDQQLANGAGYITASSAPVTSVNGLTGAVSLNIPTRTSQLTNDSQFVAQSSLATVAFTGNYNDLTNKPTGTGTTGGSAGGDLSGTYPNPKVAGLNGTALSAMNGVVCDASGTVGVCGSLQMDAAIGFTPENASNKGAANGYAPLVNSVIPRQYLPASGSLTAAQIDAALGYAPENPANKGAANGYVPLNANSTIDPQYMPPSGTLTAAEIDAALGYVPIPPSSIGQPNGIVPLNSSGQIDPQYFSAAGTLTYQEVVAALGFTPENVADKGAINGYAGLDSNGHVYSNEIAGLAATSIADGSVSNQVFEYLDGATSNIQAQINALQTNAGCSACLQKANNLSDVANAALSLANLGGGKLSGGNTWSGVQTWQNGPLQFQDIVTMNGGGAVMTALTLSGIPVTPSAPSITPINGASTSYTYYVVADDEAAGTSLPSAATTINNGPSSLSLSSYNIVSWSPVSGAGGYYVYRQINGGAFQIIIMAGASSTTLIDNGTKATSAATALPIENSTGGMLTNGPVRLNGSVGHHQRVVTATDTASGAHDHTLLLNGSFTENLTPAAEQNYQAGQELYLINTGSGTVTINGNGTSIWQNGSTVSSFSLAAGTAAILELDVETTVGPPVVPIWRQIK